MKICLVSREYPPETWWGGIGTYTYNLAHGLSKLGNEVHVVSYAPDFEKDYRDGEVYVHRIKEKKIRGQWRLERYLPVPMLLYSIRISKKLTELIQQYQIQLIEFPNWYGEGFWFLLFNRNKIRVFTRLHTPYFEVLEIQNKKAQLIDRIKCWIEKVAVLRSDNLTCSTIAHSKKIANAYNIKSDKIKIIPLGVSVSTNKTNLPEVQIDKNRFNILFVSRLEKRKGIETLLSVIPKLLIKYQNLDFYIVGRDANNKYRNEFVKKYENFSSRIHFMGFLKKEEVESYYNQCNLFVVPSLYESFGLIYLEAMKYGKAVIACNAGGIPEVIEDGETGFLVEPKNPDKLLAAIEHLIENKDILSRMSMQALERVNNYFTVEKMAYETNRLYSTSF